MNVDPPPSHTISNLFTGHTEIKLLNIMVGADADPYTISNLSISFPPFNSDMIFF